jgi:4-hydroxythreonine-4-phosphate dehydrogenase
MKPLAISLGDPAGIGTEVVLKAVAKDTRPAKLFGSAALTRQLVERLHLDAEFGPDRPLQLIDVDHGDETPVEFGHVDSRCGKIALASIDAAVDAVMRGECSALLTAPIHKQAVAAAGMLFPGHTELLASKAGLTTYGRDYAMYFDSPTLKVVLLTVHISLRQAIGMVSRDSIRDLALLTKREFTKIYRRAPKIGVPGVNPHAGEGGKFGDDEEEVAAGVELARETGVDISGPYAPDTIFRSAREGAFDVVLALFHDQGLIPVKTVHFDESVNVTLGLPYLRVSVDHGTAFDIAGKGIADEKPMRYAIEWAHRHALQFRK